MSGIYIQGMEMPDGFAERGFVIRGDGRVRTFAGAVIDYATAVPVPPHGDLIDKHDAQKLIYQGMPTKSLADAMSRLIFDAPTIIPADPADKEEKT